MFVSQKPTGCLLELVETLVLTVLIFVGIQTFVAQPYKVQQGSMETTLMPDQYVLVDKLSPRWHAYQRGDIIVFEPPPSWNEGLNVPFIKRVIGVAGDTVNLKDGKVYVNGVALVEPYIFTGPTGPQTSEPAPGGASQWLIPEGELFVMGDHRQDSADSRNFGPIQVSKVIGRAWLRYWPFDQLSFVVSQPHPELASPAP